MEDVEGDEHWWGAEDSAVGVPDEMKAGDEMLVEAATSPSRTMTSGRRFATAAATSGKRRVWSTAFRLRRLTLPASILVHSEAVKNREVCVVPLSSITSFNVRMREEEREHTLPEN